MKLLLLLLSLPALALAHPISQGALEIETKPGNLHIRARVPVEEVFLAGNAATLTEAWQQHGEYFLQHFHISAGERELLGKVTGIAEADPEHIIYDLEYPAVTKQLSLRQNLLNEISYAPGNPWEATYVVRVDGKGPWLLTSKAPLDVAGHEQHGMFGQYLWHGILHILTGYDHLLFIAALALAVVSLGDLIKVISVFTLAHTVTLTLSVLNIIRLPSHIVEPMIAGSIVFVALTNVFWPERSRGKLRLATAFFFGFFHGLGFAGGLLDAMEGLPGISIGIAIIAFSLGVELGHQMIVLPVFGAKKLVPTWPVLRYASAAISVAGMFYLVAALR